MTPSSKPGPIGVFDSGYGGLTILHELRKALPEYDYLYLGDNARAPYGARSYDVVYQFTRQAVNKLFNLGCHLVILACNTASAKALRTIQQRDLPTWDAQRRVLGVIRPTAEIVGSLTKTRHVGVLATEGTIRSKSYNLEIAKLHPDITIVGQECPLWAAIVEAGEADSAGADFFVRQRIGTLLEKDPKIDTVLLGCTHYPLLMHTIRKHIPPHIKIVEQGKYVSESLKSYLARHPEIEEKTTKNGSVSCLTTENEEKFIEKTRIFLKEDLQVAHIDLE